MRETRTFFVTQLTDASALLRKRCSVKAALRGVYAKEIPVKKIISAAIATTALTITATMTALAGSWGQQNGSWVYLNDVGQLQTGWAWIDGNQDGIAESYYFDLNGCLATATTTPDGYTVNSDGAWVQDGSVQTKVIPLSNPNALGRLGTVAGSSSMSSDSFLVAGSAYENGKNYMHSEEALQQVTGRKDIVNFARQYVGAGKLRYGTGTNLNGGPVDCSGFVLAVFRQFGISLPRTSAEQCAAAPRYVSEAEMLPGDLIFYGNGGRVNHVAIYTGENSIVHATNSSRGWVFEDSGSSAMHYAPIIAIGRYW